MPACSNVSDRPAKRHKLLRFEVVPTEFEATYDWQEVVEGQSVPPGLEVRMDLWKHSNFARIPDVWRMQVWVESASRFFRQDVARHSMVGDIAKAAAAFLGLAAQCVELRLGPQPRGQEDSPVSSPPLASHLTVEEADLFPLQNLIRIVVRSDGVGEVEQEGECALPQKKTNLRRS